MNIQQSEVLEPASPSVLGTRPLASPVQVEIPSSRHPASGAAQTDSALPDAPKSDVGGPAAFVPGARPPSPVDPQPSTLNSQPSTPFPRQPGETPRAYSAFMAFFQLGHSRSLPALASKLGEELGTLKNWSSKHDWLDRIQAFNSGLLQQHAHEQSARQLKSAADWAGRLESFRERDWETSEKLATAARCFLETFGEDDLRKMTLAQVSRALKVASDIARSAFSGAQLPPSTDPVMSPVQQQMLDALNRLSAPAVPKRSIAAHTAPERCEGGASPDPKL